MVHKWMRSNANIVICSVAIIDLLSGMVTIVVSIIRYTDWVHVPSWVCSFVDTVDTWTAMASLAHVLAVNAERYLAIVFPLKYKYVVSASRIRLILLGIWVVTLVEAILIGIDTVLDEHCDNIGTRVPGLTLVVFLLGIALPVVALL